MTLEGAGPSANDDGFLQTQGLVKRFGAAVAVDKVSLSIRKGEIFALLGSSGCGKSTLLRMLAGFDVPSEGAVLLNGVDIAPLPPHQRPINMMFQSYALFPHLNVWDNIAFGLKREGMPKAQLTARVDEMLGLVQLRELAQRMPHQLSGGQQQRVALARSLAKKPLVLLLDEPLGALDRKLREQTQFELVNIINKVGVTCVMVTHDQHEAMSMASRIAVMSQGKVLQVGTPREIYESPNCRFVADFIGTINFFEGKVAGTESNTFNVQTSEGILTLEGVSDSDNRIGAAVSAPVAVAVRPERIKVSKSHPGERANLLSGQVQEIAYLGSQNSFLIVTAAGHTVKVSSPSSTSEPRSGPDVDAPNISRGDRLWFWWDAAASVLLTR